MKIPLPLPQICLQPWWFPVQEVRNPLVLYLEAQLADLIFNPKGAIILEIEWINQILLTMDIVNAENLVKITGLWTAPCTKLDGEHASEPGNVMPEMER